MGLFLVQSCTLMVR